MMRRWLLLLSVSIGSVDPVSDLYRGSIDRIVRRTMRPLLIPILISIGFLSANAPLARSVTFNDGQVHVIDAANSFPFDSEMIIEDGPSGTTTTVSFVDGGEFSTQRGSGLITVRGASRLLVSGGLIQGDVQLSMNDSCFPLCQTEVEISGGVIRGTVITLGQFNMSGGQVNTVVTIGPFAFTGGTISELRIGGTSVVIEGGNIGQFDGSSGGGTVQSIGSATVTMLSGSARHVRAQGDSQFRVIGGTVSDSFTSSESGHITIRGGVPGSSLVALDVSMISVVGEGFNFPYGELIPLSGILNGALADGTLINSQFGRASGASIRLVVEEDPDGDGVFTGIDNCPGIANPAQTDSDSDGIGDACNDAIDSDGDEWADSLDNCPAVSNGDQANGDLDLLGDACDPFPTDPDNEQAQCEADLGICATDFAFCDTSLTSCSTDLGSTQGDLIQCESNGVLLQQSLDACQEGLPVLGDVNWDGSVDLLDSVFLRRHLAGLPVEPPRPGVTALKLRKADNDRLIETVQNGDVFSLAGIGACLGIQAELNSSSSSIRYDWTPPGGAEIQAHAWENNAPFCWANELGWAFVGEVANCGCSPEMAQLGEHRVVFTPCSVDVDFGSGQTCIGNGGVEGPSTSVRFTIAP